MKNIYVVFGQTGEYEDYSQWSVQAFKSETSAKKFAEKCQAWVDENIDKNEYWKTPTKSKHPLDPKFWIDYTGTSYLVRAIPFVNN